MPGAIRKKMKLRICMLVAVCVPCCQVAWAKPGGEPLVLDTQTGIHSGVSGTVLQSAPLGAPGMVPMATLPGLQQQEQQPIVVSPYVQYGGESAVSPGTSQGHYRRQRAPYP
ncbi:hypothetical protein [Caballeronia sp. LZ016]|uniref:hypothetical protein n=1 Tax=Caballeronia sp. LZ016 TaxID=3038554 RepID=UPI002858834F|nr:hypothetical protein [Caballeronia sp. LZ016]MDR5738135.1 hypothetical protein [Caballeronia sp. LZ016]